jgi:hypothetical protein
MNEYGSEYLDMTDEREPVLPDYEEWERENEMSIEEKDKMMEEIDEHQRAF